MPSGGQIPGQSPGLRLQANTPGVRDVGNANISGTMIAGAGVFPGPASVRNQTGDTQGQGAGNPNVNIGDQNVWTTTGANGPFTCVAIGFAVKIQQSPGGNMFQGAIAIGNNATVGSSGGVAIGEFAKNGDYTNSNGEGGGVVIGSSSYTVNWGTQSAGNPILIGVNNYINHVQGSAWLARQDIMIGNSNHHNITAGGALGNCIIISNTGQQMTNCSNMIIIDNNQDTWNFPRGFNTQSNQIIIGNSTHTSVQIGAKTFSNGIIGQVQKIADTAYTVLATDGTVIYTSISAARIVTLPTAAAFGVGARILVNDASGSASGVNTITLTRAGADTINAGTTSVINVAYGCKELQSDGVSKWTVIRSI